MKTWTSSRSASAELSISVIVAWAHSERTNATCSAFSIVRSSTYWPWPVMNRGSSRRRTRCPIICVSWCRVREIRERSREWLGVAGAAGPAGRYWWYLPLDGWVQARPDAARLPSNLSNAALVVFASRAEHPGDEHALERQARPQDGGATRHHRIAVGVASHVDVGGHDRHEGGHQPPAGQPSGPRDDQPHPARQLGHAAGVDHRIGRGHPRRHDLPVRPRLDEVHRPGEHEEWAGQRAERASHHPGR